MAIIQRGMPVQFVSNQDPARYPYVQVVSSGDDARIPTVNLVGGDPARATLLQAIASGDTGRYPRIKLAESFYVPFNDLGSGQVDTNLVAGTGSAAFTRATTATTVNSAGLIVSVASGTPRSYYDPTTLQYGGYLAEGARTNLCLQSEDLSNASWTKSAVTVTANSTASPDGTTTADLVTNDAGTPPDRIFTQTITITADSTFTFSAFCKIGNNNWTELIVFNGGNGVRAWFNLSTGVVGTANSFGSGSGATSSIKAYPNGWYRCTLTGAANGGFTSVGVGIRSTTADAVETTAASSTEYIWGAQLEAGSFASSYIPTTTASVTRNADVLTYPSSGNALFSGGSAYMEAALFVPAASTNFEKLFSLNDGTTNNAVSVDAHGGGDSNPYVNYVTGGVSQGYIGGGTNLDSTPDKVAISWGTNLLRIAQNGTITATDTGVTTATGQTTIAIGNLVGAQQLFGTIRNVRIYQTQLSAAQLQSLTS